MPLNGSGTYNPPSPEYPAVSGEIIYASDFNTIMADIASALSQAVYRDGQAAFTGPQSMGSQRITFLANGVASTDAINLGQLNAIFGTANSWSAKQTLQAGVDITGGNINVTNLAATFKADFSDNTLSNRFSFQTNVTNGNTTVAARPNGTGTIASWFAYNNQDISNSSGAGVSLTASTAYLYSLKLGTGAYLPLHINVNNTDQLIFKTDGSWGLAGSSGGVGNAGQALISQGAGIPPYWGDVTGLGELPITVVTGTSQAASDDQHYVLTNAAATTVTLPASPRVGSKIFITTSNGLATNLVARNGKEIMGLAEDLTIDVPYMTVQLRYVGNSATTMWRII